MPADLQFQKNTSSEASACRHSLTLELDFSMRDGTTGIVDDSHYTCDEYTRIIFHETRFSSDLDVEGASVLV